MDEEWRNVPGFPKYEVSDGGVIRNRKTERPLRPTINQQGHHKVNLSRNGVIYTRNVNQIVAHVYLAEPMRDDFTSVIHLDGDKTNCHADNLMWRPRSFAIRYHQQFRDTNWKTSRIPIIEKKTRETFDDIQQACVVHGLLFSDVLISAHERTYVWPTFHEFLFLEN